MKNCSWRCDGQRGVTNQSLWFIVGAKVVAISDPDLELREKQMFQIFQDILRLFPLSQLHTHPHKISIVLVFFLTFLQFKDKNYTVHFLCSIWDLYSETLEPNKCMFFHLFSGNVSTAMQGCEARILCGVLLLTSWLGLWDRRVH